MHQWSGKSVYGLIGDEVHFKEMLSTGLNIQNLSDTVHTGNIKLNLFLLLKNNSLNHEFILKRKTSLHGPLHFSSYHRPPPQESYRKFLG